MKTFSVSVAVVAISGVSTSVLAASPGKISGNQFNPSVSVILDGSYTRYDEDFAFELPGFMLGGEAGISERGFSVDHSELTLSANVDDKFFAQMTTAIVQEEGESGVELEEAWFETLGLGNGFTVKAGQFFSGLGYLNQQHKHAYDFVDAPLVYQGLFGGKLIDKGVQARWLAPTDTYMEFGLEALSGSGFPGGETEDGSNAYTAFVKTGGDISVSSSWQLGLSHYSNEFLVREAGAHAHGAEEAGPDIELENGEADISGVDFVYKWAPQGNPAERNFKLQLEYFRREEQGESSLSDELERTASADYDGEQSGFYVSAIYQFKPRWRVGLRYDQLMSDNALASFDNTAGAEIDGVVADEEAFAEATGLESPEKDPEAVSLMLDYSNSEFSRLRFQLSDMQLGESHDGDEKLEDTVFSIQYLMSLGAHGAHRF